MYVHQPMQMNIHLRSLSVEQVRTMAVWRQQPSPNIQKKLVEWKQLKEAVTRRHQTYKMNHTVIHISQQVICLKDHTISNFTAKHFSQPNPHLSRKLLHLIFNCWLPNNPVFNNTLIFITSMYASHLFSKFYFPETQTCDKLKDSINK